MSCIRLCAAPVSDPSIFGMMILLAIFGAIGGYLSYGPIGAIAGFVVGFLFLPATLVILGIVVVILIAYIAIMAIVYLGEYLISLV